jgi:hypothetical protein
MKKCIKCLEELDELNFSQHSGSRNYLRSECKKCNNRLSKERNILKKEHKYPEDGYRCPICLKYESELKGAGGKASTWVLDHDHSSGKYRGYLCHNCNRALGNFGDNIERIERAIDYLKIAGEVNDIPLLPI